MRGRAGFGAEAEEEDVYAAQSVEPFEVMFEPAFEVGRISAHRREALNLCEEGFAEQTLEVAHKAQTVLHAHRRERVLSEDLKPSEQFVGFACAREARGLFVHRLRAAAA